MAAPNLHNNLRDRVQDILRSDPCQAIDFTYSGVHIDGSGYYYVALALISKNGQQGGLKIKTVADGETLGSGVGAKYNMDDDKIVFKDDNFGQQAEEQAAIVHECTHALIDARNDNVSQLVHEICAYLAMAMYNIRLAHPATMSTPPRQAAQSVALAVKAARAANGGSGPIALTDTDVLPLRTAIMASNTYKNKDMTSPLLGGGLPLSPP